LREVSLEGILLHLSKKGSYVCSSFRVRSYMREAVLLPTYSSRASRPFHHSFRLCKCPAQEELASAMLLTDHQRPHVHV
jgi:hypothetical protein